jgi:hypothetical protein
MLALRRHALRMLPLGAQVRITGRYGRTRMYSVKKASSSYLAFGAFFGLVGSAFAGILAIVAVAQGLSPGLPAGLVAILAVMSAACVLMVLRVMRIQQKVIKDAYAASDLDFPAELRLAGRPERGHVS